MADCPSPEDLGRYLSCGAADASTAAIGEHLEVCPACQERLDREQFPRLAASLRVAEFFGRATPSLTARPGPEGSVEDPSTPGGSGPIRGR